MEFFILILYILSLLYVFQSIVAEIEELTIIEFDKAALQEQLVTQKLDQLLEISFGFPDTPLTDSIRDFQLTIKNKSAINSFCIHWNQTTIIDLEGQSQRIIRLSPSLNIDLVQSQIMSIIASEATLKESLTIENKLKLNANKVFEINDPLFDLKKLQEARNKQTGFALELIIQKMHYGQDMLSSSIQIIVCKFTIAKLPWQKAIYWQSLKKKKP